MDEAYTNIFDALEEYPGIAQNLYVRSRLMIKLKARIAEQKLSHAAAAERLDVPQSALM
jgi:predicted XRE-type DNA-binding protein